MSIDQSVITFAKALADETRQEIMKLLCCEWLSVNDVVDALGGRVNQPTVSHHLKLLAEAELVECGHNKPPRVSSYKAAADLPQAQNSYRMLTMRVRMRRSDSFLLIF